MKQNPNLETQRTVSAKEKSEPSERQKRIKELAVIGNSVELQTRLNDDSPVTHRGIVTKVEEPGSFEVTLDDGQESPIGRKIIRFNSSGICMPWLIRLQVKWKEGTTQK